MGKLTNFILFKKPWLVLSILFFASSLPAYAQTFSDAINFALANSPNLAVQNERIIETEIIIRQVQAGKKINASLSSRHSYRVDELNYDYSRSSSSSVNIGLEKLLLDAGNLKSREQSAYYRAVAQKETYKDVRQNVIFTATNIYIDYFTNLQAIEIRKNSVKILERQLLGTNLRYKIGEGTITDIALAESRLSTAKTELIFAQNRLNTNILNFERIFGFPPTRNLVKMDLSKVVLPNSIESSIMLARENNPQIAITKLLQKSADQNLKSSKSEFKPKLTINTDIFSRYNYLDQFNGLRNPNSVDVYLRYSMPLLTGGRRSTSKNIAISQNNIAKIQVLDVHANITKDVKIAWNDVEIAKLVIGHVKTGVKAAQTALKGTIKERDAGIRPQIDVLNAEQELLERKLSLIEAEKKIIVSTLKLLLVMGQIGLVAV